MPDLDARVRSAFASSAIDADIVDELAQHAESTYDELRADGVSEQDALARFTARVPVGRLVRPEEVAEAVLYFCSPAAAAATGATLVIGADGA